MYDIPCSVKDCLIMIELKMSLVEVFLGESRTKCILKTLITDSSILKIIFHIFKDVTQMLLRL